LNGFLIDSFIYVSVVVEFKRPSKRRKKMYVKTCTSNYTLINTCDYSLLVGIYFCCEYNPVVHFVTIFVLSPC
jgi:hypothetical protein